MKQTPFLGRNLMHIFLGSVLCFVFFPPQPACVFELLSDGQGFNDFVVTNVRRSTQWQMPTGKGIFKLSLGKDNLSAKTRIWVCVKIEFTARAAEKEEWVTLLLFLAVPYFSFPDKYRKHIKEALMSLNICMKGWLSRGAVWYYGLKLYIF